ncbi:hypothetical protein SSX86_031548 [Deinandra increscens subsp. villosa]|uniref:C2H2-type domain-containing protein n=1 Tax=Deinandra increscens subsp. villosa TaxID=3103831 RepID=A0AAP0GHB8_9ASTR
MENCLMLLSRVGQSSSLPEPVFSCKTCNKKFMSHQALGGHCASHKRSRTIYWSEIETPPNQPKKHECSVCGSEFRIGQALGGHMRRHSYEKSLQRKKARWEPLAEKRARTLNRPAAAAVSGGGGGQILHPIRRHLPFSSTRPPFIPSDDYHRFPSGNGGDVAGTTAYQNAEVIIVKSPYVKRKLGADYNKVPSNEWANIGYTDTVNSTLHTPVSAKGGRINARSKVTKSNKPAPQTPVSNTGET